MFDLLFIIGGWNETNVGFKETLYDIKIFVVTYVGTFKHTLYFLSLCPWLSLFCVLRLQLSICRSNMEDTTGSTADLFSDPALWQNESFLFNMTAANTSSVYTPLIPPVLNRAINVILTVALTITMVSLGCTMEVSKIKVTSGDVDRGLY